MSELPLVSIIIPVYNSARYLEETLWCVINQTWPNKELIIVDDGSTDNSLAVAKQFKQPWITVCRQKNSGASVARNKGLEKAKGDYIQFLDADDLISSNKIEEQIKLLENNPDSIAVCPTVYFRDGESPYIIPVTHEWYSVGSSDNVDFLIKLYGGPLIGPGYGGMVQPNAWLTPRYIIDKAGPWNEMRNPDDDGEFFCRVILGSKGICYVPNATNYYRKFNNDASLSAQKNRDAISNILKSTKLKAKHLLSQTKNPLAKLALSRLFWEVATVSYPKFKDITKEAIILANQTYKYKPKNLYTYTKFYRTVTFLFGWRVSAWISYIKNR